MGTGYNLEHLQAEIFERSAEKANWYLCKKEWRVANIFRVAEEQVCLCGHHPIYQICEIRNDLTKKPAHVGNVCVQKFMELKSKRLFAALARVEKDPSKSLNKDILEMYMHLGVIGVQELEEYLSFYRRWKNVTEDQRKFKSRINSKILKYALEKSAQHQAAYKLLDKH